MKYQKLGPVIRAARGARGLEQADLARMLNVGQQAVSAWELGSSRPRAKQLATLAEILGVGIDELRLLGEYEQSATPVAPPRMLTLPLGALSEDAFEAFCRDLARALFPRREVSRNGSRGFKQHGVDVIVDGEGERIGIQCKRHETFGPSQVAAAVREVDAAANFDRCVIALSRKVATPNARLEAAKAPGWTIWDGEDLSSRVRSLASSDALALVDAYFPELREPFLGIPAPSPWRRVAEFDTALAGRLGYDRDFQLTGRERELEALRDLVSRGSPLAFVVGRGGIGKSRLLAELGRTEGDREVRFASGDALTSAAYDLLPPGDPIVVVDDAGDTGPRIADLVAGIRAARPGATIVLATRPRTLPELLVSLRVTEHDAATCRIDIGDLELDEAERLARRALGEDEAIGVVEGLARVGYDCPLLIIIGAHLVRGGHIRIEAIGSSPSLRQEILTHFADTLVRGPGNDVRLAVLEALAALQPANMDRPDILEALGSTAGVGETVALDCIDELEDLGLVIRRGMTVRVVPDLLGEAILERSLVGRGGRDRRFAATLAANVRSTALTNAIRNVSIVDWRRRADGQSELADILWGALDNEARSAGNSQRIGLVAGVQDVAGVYPTRALDIAEAILANPAPDEASALSVLRGDGGVITATDCNRSLAVLVRNAAYTPDNLERSMRLLRTIGRDDPRPENQNPSHAMRLLRELGEYGSGTPVSFHLEYTRIVKGWIATAETSREVVQCLGLLKAALADEVTITRSRRMSIEWSRRSIDLDATAPIRRAVVEAANERVDSEPAEALAAIDLLEELLRAGDPSDPVTDEFRLAAITLERVMSSPAHSPSVRLSAYRALGWHAKYGKGTRRDLARTTRKQLIRDVDLLVTSTIRSGWIVDDETDEEFSFERAQHRNDDIAAQAIAAWGPLSDTAALAHLMDLVRSEHQATQQPVFPERLFARLVEARPLAAYELIAINDSQDPIVAAAQSVALASLFSSDPDSAMEATEALIDRGEDGALIVARAVFFRQEGPLGATRTAVLRALRVLDLKSVERAIVGALRWFNDADRSLALEVILTTAIADDSRIAAEVASVLTDDRVISWEMLTEEQRGTVLRRLEVTPNVSEYSIEQLLARQIAVDPLSVVRLLMARIDNPQEGVERFEPIPHPPVPSLNFRASPHFRAILAELVRWLTIDDDDWRRAFYGNDLFELVVGPIDAEVLAVVSDLIDSREESQVALAARLLGKAGHGFLLANVPFVVETLSRIETYPPQLAQRVRAGLKGSAVYGIRSRTVGEDNPAEIVLRDAAMTVAKEFPEGSVPRAFYSEVSDDAARRLVDEREDDRRLRDPRSW
ncbi:helix-turn-helix domain-containing protein [Microbacterium aureliae]